MSDIIISGIVGDSSGFTAGITSANLIGQTAAHVVKATKEYVESHTNFTVRNGIAGIPVATLDSIVRFGAAKQYASLSFASVLFDSVDRSLKLGKMRTTIVIDYVPDVGENSVPVTITQDLALMQLRSLTDFLEDDSVVITGSSRAELILAMHSSDLR